MPKKSKNAKRSSSWEATYDLPSELDFSKLRVVGVGMDAMRKHVASKPKTVELDADVAQDFPTAKKVNEALRQFREMQRVAHTTRRKKSA